MPVRALPDNLQKVVENDLNEVPNRVEEDIKSFKEWVAKQPHLRANTDDQWILTFLRGCKFRTQIAKEKFEQFYTLRTALPDFYTGRDPLLPDLQELLSRRMVLPFPVNKSGPQVILLQCDDGDIGKLSLTTVVKCGTMMVDLILHENDYMVYGQYVIVDLQLIRYEYFAQLSLFLLKTLVKMMQNAYPVRPKGFFFIDAPTAFKAMFNIVSTFMRKKALERCHFCDPDNLSQLTDLIPNEILPKEYGGSGASFEELRVIWKKKMEDCRDWFIESEQYGVDESKKITDGSSNYGVEGSFRMLQLD